MLKNLLCDDSEDHDMFIFGEKYDINGNIGKSTEANHLNVCFFRKTLLKRLTLNGQFHVDCTHKIIKYFYPVFIF